MKYLLLLPLFLFLTACKQIENIRADIEIESPLRNICQSGDLDPDFPKCELR